MQASRFSLLLTLIVVWLVLVVMVGNLLGVSAALSVSLFPLAILTHTAERFWTMATEAAMRQHLEKIEEIVLKTME